VSWLWDRALTDRLARRKGQGHTSWPCRGAFKELRSCPPREKEPVQPWEGDALDVDIALILFLQLVCSGGFFLNLLDRLVTLLLRAARFEAN